MKSTPSQHGHRHSLPGQHEHEYEPQHGLPELLPEGEVLLWQGSPAWKMLAVRRFHVRKLVIYFAVLLGVRLATLLSEGLPLSAALWGTTFLLTMAVIAVGLVTLIAWFTARTTVYTLTNRRVVMRIGIVLTLSLNLPLRRLEAADLNLHSGKLGDIALSLLKPDRIAYLHLWPHARPWHMSRPQPTLLCLDDAQAVAHQLTDAWRKLTADAASASPSTSVAEGANASTTAQTELMPGLATR